LHTRAVPELRGRLHFYLFLPIDAADLSQRIAYEVSFGRELCLVIDVLKLASAAYAIVNAWRFPPVRAGLDDPNDRSAGEVAFELCYADVQYIAGRSKGHENYQRFKPSHAFAAIGQPIQVKPDYVSD
jgi:hypothetical protein